MGYKELYDELFSAVTDAIKLLCAGDALGAMQLLMQAQRGAEDTFLRDDFKE